MGRLCVNRCGLPGASVWQMVPHSCNTVLRRAEGLHRRFECLPNWDQRKICSRLRAGMIKHSYLREKVDPTGFSPPHFASNRRAEHGWELQGRRYSRPQGFGHRPSLARLSRYLACDNTLRPAKANLIEVEICVMRADVVEHTRDGAADPVIEAFRRVDVNRTASVLAPYGGQCHAPQTHCPTRRRLSIHH
jgi:hypothetical protein